MSQINFVTLNETSRIKKQFKSLPEQATIIIEQRRIRFNQAPPSIKPEFKLSSTSVGITSAKRD